MIVYIYIYIYIKGKNVIQCFISCLIIPHTFLSLSPSLSLHIISLLLLSILFLTHTHTHTHSLSLSLSLSRSLDDHFFSLLQVESGGTVLSTNWGEVGKSTVERKPPDGMEWREYDK